MVVWKLVKFLKEHEGEWWTPYEIKKEFGCDIRTVKNNIRYVHATAWNTHHKGWRMDVAERGKRLYVVRMVRDIEGSKKILMQQLKEAKEEAEKILCGSLFEIIDSKEWIIKQFSSTYSERDDFFRLLDQARNNRIEKIRNRNLDKLKVLVEEIQNKEVKKLKTILSNLPLAKDSILL